MPLGIVVIFGLQRNANGKNSMIRLLIPSLLLLSGCSSPIVAEAKKKLKKMVG